MPPPWPSGERACHRLLRSLDPTVGWTVAVALAHITFWDRQRLCLMRWWGAGNWCNGGYDGELFNEVLLPFLETIPPDRAAEMALKTAAEVDAFLLTVPDEVVGAALARPGSRTGRAISTRSRRLWPGSLNGQVRDPSLAYAVPFFLSRSLTVSRYSSSNS
jgi:hypothetical protein